jgi:Fe-S cluster assembly protein SufD
MTQLAEHKGVHLTNFARFAGEAAGNGDAARQGRAAWLDALRRSALAQFDPASFPWNRDEHWRHTNFAPLLKTPFRPAAPAPDVPAEAVSYSLGYDAAAELVFVNGRYAPHLSQPGQLPRGVRVSSLADAIETGDPLLERHLGRLAEAEKNPFAALNTGFVRDGAVIHLARGAAVEGPIHLMFVSSSGGAEPTVSHPRVLIVAEENSEASIVESYVGAAGDVYFTNAVTEIVAGRGARIDHNKLQWESRDAFHVATTQARLDRDASFVSHSGTIGGRLTRNDLNVVLSAPGAEATLNGLVLIGGTQHVDNHTLLDHAAPNCPSHELYKHVLEGRSTGVFKGKILVRQAAQKTDSKQTSKTLLLSDDAVMNSMPALEIYADDVKCTHGSTTGPVDEGMVFYIRSRGVSLDAARHLLSYAFAADITRRIKVEPVRRRLEEHMAAQHGLPQDLRITDLGRHDEEHRT